MTPQEALLRGGHRHPEQVISDLDRAGYVVIGRDTLLALVEAGMGNLDQEAWIEQGVIRGFGSEPFCGTHDQTPGTEREYDAFEEGLDPCQPLIRLWTDGDYEGRVE